MSNDVAWNSLLKPHENLGIFWRIIASATGMNFELFLPFCGRTYVATTKSSALKGLEVHSDHNIDESVFRKNVKKWIDDIFENWGFKISTLFHQLHHI